MIERLDDNNSDRWSKLAEFEDQFGFNLKRTMASKMDKPLVGNPSEGALYFKKVLDDVDRRTNQVWIAYITDDLQFSAVDYERWKKSVLYCMTVVTSPDARITSHIGINKTVEGLQKDLRGNSVCLHSLAAKVMLSINPERRFMINTPTWVMESIMADALPQDSLFAGTREMKARLDKIANMTFEDYLESDLGITEKLQKKMH